MAPKRKVKAQALDADYEDDFIDPEDEPKPKKKRSTPKKPPKAEPQTPEQQEKLRFWSQHASVLCRLTGPDPSAFQPGKKIAAFDLDGTLAHYKRGQKFALDENDWRLFNKGVPERLNTLEAEGYKIVIFSNQHSVKSAMEGKAAIKVRMRLEHVLDAIKLDGICAFMACADDAFRKPQLGMWEHFVDRCNGGLKAEDIDMAASFYVGDAAGRGGDYASSDLEFAAAAGLTFKTPEEVFGPSDKKPEAQHVELADGDEGPNAALASKFLALAETQENPFAARANRKSAEIIKHFGSKVTAVDQMKGVAGIGKGSLALIKEFLETGTFARLEEGAPETVAREQAKTANQQMAMQFL